MTASRRATLAFAAALTAATLAVLGLHVAPAGQDVMIRSFHLQPATPVEFAAVQVLPTMYTAQNRVWVSDWPLDWDEINTDSPGGIFVQHYPAGFITGSPNEMRRSPCPRYAALESRLRGRTFRTLMQIQATDTGIQLLSSSTPPAGCPS